MLMFSELGISTTFFDYFYNITDFGSRDKRAKKKKKETLQSFIQSVAYKLKQQYLKLW